MGVWKKTELENESQSIVAPAPRAAGARTSTAGGQVATIGPSITIEGDVKGEEDLVIEGRIAGNVTLPNNKVTLGETGHLKARVVAESITIQGEVEGDLIAEQEVVLRPSGSVVGNIVAPRVSLEKGCRFKGSIDMEKAATKAPKKQTQPKEEPVASTAKTSELLASVGRISITPISPAVRCSTWRVTAVRVSW